MGSHDSSGLSVLGQARAAYAPKLPQALRQKNIRVELGAPVFPASDRAELRQLFPRTYGQRGARITAGGARLSGAALDVGVVLSGGPAPGGHNVIAGLFDALKAASKDSTLTGFLRGPKGIIDNKRGPLGAEVVEPYRNTGGFDLLGSGRDKIEKPEEFVACKSNVQDLDGLVIIGGDDSNTNAAVLAEYFLAQGVKTRVIGVPKTIDGDMKSREIETSFGFDTAAKTYAELIGNICRDAMSSGKYWHFIRLMGRSASHITLECALRTHPNLALISEEIHDKKMTLNGVVDMVVEVIEKRRALAPKRKYGVVLLPEGLPESIPEFRRLLAELSAHLGPNERAGMKYVASLPSHTDRVQWLSKKLSDHSMRVYSQLPEDAQEVLLKLDKHGHPLLSQVETERMLIDLVSDKIRDMHPDKKLDDLFSPLPHFMGYEGRCGAPSNFDTSYGYALGYAAAQLLRAGLTGYTVHLRNLAQPPDRWVAGGTPITALMNMEMRKGTPTAVVKKTLVDLKGKPFKHFARERKAWELNDAYVFPGPIQFFGPPAVCDAPPITLRLEHNAQG